MTEQDDFANQASQQVSDKGPQTIVANAVCLAIAFVGLFLRFLSRRWAKAHLGIDDWLTAVALILYIGTAIDGFICISVGAGRHENQVKSPAGFAKASFAFIILYRLSIALVKFSVLFLYRRIFPQANFKRILTWYGGFVLLYTVVFLLLDIFHCRQISHAWDPTTKMSCINMDTIWIVGGSLNAVTDIGALCLPMPLLWRLHVTREKRIQLMGVFLVGGFVCIVSMIRVIEIAGQHTDYDESWGYSTTIVWSTVEVGIGIFCACLPVMRPVLRRLRLYVPTMESTRNPSGSSSYPKSKSSRQNNFRMANYRPSERQNDWDERTRDDVGLKSTTGVGDTTQDGDEVIYDPRSIAVTRTVEIREQDSV